MESYKLVGMDLSFIDYPSPNTWSIIIYMSGCEHKCPGCQNFELQKPDQGKIYTEYSLIPAIKDFAKSNRTNNIVLSGGDPLYKTNLDTTNCILNNLSLDYNICIYTGYDINYAKSLCIKGFKFIKCGTYDQTKKCPSGNFETYIQLASTNQNFYDSNFNLLSKNGRLNYNEFKQ